jgi:diaminohydroxyphosphoribosylaminopyrimidine deaminase/5-amino-6-(5-phosphoribosylamino)uracil reductase
MTSSDERFMRRALELAERGRGLTSPNPMVGAVVVAPSGEIVGEGVHMKAGGPHAEIEALRAAGPRARGAMLYLTLEPCAHQGRTPPCATAIVGAGVARVVAPLVDPNPLVAGRGFEALRRAGVEVDVGLLSEEAALQNRVFFTAMRERRPHVTLKAAMTLDGKIADTQGASRWITGERARARAHRLRSEADAIVVGITTVLRDDPELTVRLDEPWPREPYRVALDTEGRTPPGARFMSAGDPARAVVAVGDGVPEERVRPLRAAGATVIRCPRRDGRVDLGFLLGELFAREVRGVLVEGGGEVHAAFLDAGLVDRVAVFLAPLLVGGRAAPSVVGGAGRELKSGVRLGPLTVTPVGDDILVEADVIRGPRGA